MPYRIQSPIKKDTLIERLQHLGAHSYGGSLEAITRANTKENTVKDHHIYAQVNKRENRQSEDFVETVTVAIIENVPGEGSQEHLNFLIRNDRYDDENNSERENAYSRISSDCEIEKSTKLVPEYCEVHISESENVYSVPCSPKDDRHNTDHNKNVLVELNETYVSSSPEPSNGEEDSKISTRELEYEDVDAIPIQSDVDSALYQEVSFH